MAESLVLAILEKLTSITAAEVKLVGVDDEVRRLTRNFWAIRAVLEDAESRQAKEKNVGDWLDRLKDVSYDMDDVLNEWSTSLRKLQIKQVENASKRMRMVCSLIPRYRFCSTNVVLRHDIALKIKDLNRKLDVIATEKKVFNFSLKRGTTEFKRPVTASIIDDVSNIHVRDGDNDTLLSGEESWLLFSKIAFFERTSEECKNLEDIGRKLIGKCKGLPLAIKTLGGLLHLKSSIKEWQSVLDSEIWELEQVERGIFPPLLLSYYDLPSTLRKCFSYCSIFLKDYKIEKEKLIKLWMAQNYIKDEPMKDMELRGEEYFENLAMRSFFQDFERNEFDGTVESCKMHDIVYDFAQFLTKNECFSVKIDESRESQIQFSYGKARHLVLAIKSGDTFPMSIYNAKHLRSLVVECETMSNMNLSKLFVEFTCLRRIDLSDSGITILPREIKKLIHLRYLDLSKNKKLKKLPEELCELYNLQTLNLDICTALKKLPEQMERLINLRHLINDRTCFESLREMPKGLATLTCLRSLGEFGVCRNSGLEYLKDLNNLRGCLDIVRLGDSRNVGQLSKANLISKTNLLSLRLYFDPREENRNGIDEGVLEALLLQPPPNLERLEIDFYEGKTLSLNWMVSLTKLRFLRLDSCINWEEWEKGDEDITIIMPSLHSLSIEVCEKLKSLPDQILQTPTLKKLKIFVCPILEQCYNKDTGVDRVKISHIPDVNI